MAHTNNLGYFFVDTNIKSLGVILSNPHLHVKFEDLVTLTDFLTTTLHLNLATTDAQSISLHYDVLKSTGSLQ